MKFQSEPLAMQLSRTLNAPKRMLLLDDDKEWQAFFRERLQNYSIVITECVLVREARVLIQHETFDCIVLDQMLTNGKGVDFYAEIGPTRPNIHFVFMTGYPVEPIIERVSSIGPARVFNKTKMLENTFVDQLMAQIGVRKTLS